MFLRLTPLSLALLVLVQSCGGAGSPGPGEIQATASAPAVELELVNTFTDPVTGELKGDPAGTASVDFALDQAPGSTVAVVVEFSTDGGVTWSPATIDEDTSAITAPATGAGLAPSASVSSEFQVTWQIAADLGPGDFSSANAAVGYDAVELRVSVVGGEPSPPADEPVEVDLMGFPFPSETSLGTARAGSAAAVLGGKDLFVVGGDAAGVSISGAELGKRVDDIADFHFEPAGSLAVARAGMSQTFLADTTLLLAGGEDTFGPRSEVDLYDPADGSFTSLAPLNHARAGHAAALLPNGRVCVIGGRGDAVGGPPASNSYEIYDEGTDAWVLGSLAHSYDAPLAVLLSDGRIFVSGPAPGTDTLQAEYLRISGDAALTSVPAPLPLAARRDATATVLVSGEVLLFGGHDLGGSPSSPTAELIDPAAGTATAIPETNPNVPGYSSQGRWDHEAALTAGGRVLIAGGRTSNTGGELSRTDYFLPLENTFTPSTLLPEARSGHHVNRLESGFLVVSGGVGSDDAPLGTTATLIPPDGSDHLPTAEVSSLTWIPALGAVTLTYELFDDEANDARISVEWTTRPDNDESWRPITPKLLFGAPLGDGYTSLTTSPTGTTHIFGWDAAIDDIFATGSPVEITVRVTPLGAAAGPAELYTQVLP